MNMYTRGSELVGGDFFTTFGGKVEHVKILGDSQTAIVIRNDRNPQEVPVGKMVRIHPMDLVTRIQK